MPLTELFSGLEDPRAVDNQKYPFKYLMFISVCAAFSGIDSYVGIEDYAETHKDFFDKYFNLPYVPRHDTFSHLFSLLERDKLETWFRSKTNDLLAFIASEAPRETGKTSENNKKRFNHIAIDGKTIRNSGFLNSYHMVTAWFANHKISLGQVKIDDKSNEITAIPELIEQIDFPNDTIITIDAMGCQREICHKIIEKGCHYFIAVKENQPTPFESTVAQMEEHCDKEHSLHESSNKGHGRVEKRWCTAHAVDTQNFDYKDWPGIKAIYAIDADIVTKRRGKEKRSMSSRYFLSSVLLPADEAAEYARDHWGIEINLHWCLDVSLNEDEACIQSENSAINMNILRKFALNILEQVKGKKSMKSMFRNCAIPQNTIKILNKCFCP
jgi:predicted transposase YbfD/YdcC